MGAFGLDPLLGRRDKALGLHFSTPKLMAGSSERGAAVQAAVPRTACLLSAVSSSATQADGHVVGSSACSRLVLFRAQDTQASAE
jgi:hypothetical protein